MNASPGVIAQDDSVAIEKLNAAFEAQKAAFLTDMNPSAEVRINRVLKVRDMFRDNRKEIRSAIQADYGNHPTESAEVFEVAATVGRAEWFAKQIEGWMKPVDKKLSPILGNSKGRIQYMPKGVIGNMSPWNFPFGIAIGPVIDVLAAGNRAIIKPSEVTAQSAQVFSELVAEYFDPAVVTTAVGGLELAEHFSTLRWDHLIYTGNSAVARKVMTNAAQNLVPVTLELGGKSPCIIGPDRVDAETARLIMSAKASRRGQICINVDYLLVPADQKEQIVNLVAEDIKTLGPDNGAAGACAIVNENHYNRLNAMIEDARSKGARIEMVGEPDPESRNMPFTMILDAPDEALVNQHEIFGPLLPIITYETLDEALAYINARNHPLGLYVFSKDEGFTNKVLNNTRSGGVTVNGVGAHVQTELGFGGVGESGMGRHRGIEGFREFSNPRGIVELGSHHLMNLAAPPFTEDTGNLVNAALGEKTARKKIAKKVIGNILGAKFGKKKR